MAGLLSRTMTVIKARISKMLDKAEDPSITLDYSYEKQIEMLQQVKKGVADVTTAKKRLEMQTAKLEGDVAKLEGQARQALGAGRRTWPARRSSGRRSSSSSSRASTSR